MIHLFAPPRLGASVTETNTASRSEQTSDAGSRLRPETNARSLRLAVFVFALNALHVRTSVAARSRFRFNAEPKT
jgi:hypothetical protein